MQRTGQSPALIRISPEMLKALIDEQPELDWTITDELSFNRAALMPDEELHGLVAPAQAAGPYTLQ